jgi:hypothetical protein
MSAMIQGRRSGFSLAVAPIQALARFGNKRCQPALRRAQIGIGEDTRGDNADAISVARGGSERKNASLCTPPDVPS